MAPSREVKDCILGIDFGSTALRGGLLERDTHGFQPVENTETSQTGSYGKGDFPTACCPFKENPLDYLGKRAQSEPNNVQAKYLVYLLVGAEDNILSEYPLSAELRRMRGNKEFLAKCRAILVELLRRLKARIDEVCRKRYLTYSEVALTVPEQWAKPFQLLYISIFKEAFGWDDEETIHILAEADALAQYVMRTDADSLDDWNHVMFYDFGGHSMSYRMFKIERLTDVLSFISVDSGGTAGGGEMWSHYISELISRKLVEQGIKDVGETRRWAMMKQFNNKKEEVMEDLDAGKRDPVLLIYQEKGPNPWTAISLSAAEIMDCFERGQRKPVQLAREKLIRLTEETESSIGVVVAGGSLQWTQARDAVFSDAPECLEDRVKFTSEMEYKWLSLCNCHGAAIAIANTRSVSEFFESGAAIGIQTKTDSLSNNLWDDVAWLLLDGPESYEYKAWNRRGGNAEFKLICDPHFALREQPPDLPGQPIQHHSTKQLLAKNCYDFYHLGPQESGTFTVKCDFVASGNKPSLRLTIARMKGRMKQPKVQVTIIPLYFDRGHNCVHPDFEEMDDGVEERQDELFEKDSTRQAGDQATSHTPNTGPVPASNNTNTKSSRRSRARAPVDYRALSGVSTRASPRITAQTGSRASTRARSMVQLTPSDMGEGSVPGLTDGESATSASSPTPTEQVAPLAPMGDPLAQYGVQSVAKPRTPRPKRSRVTTAFDPIEEYHSKISSKKQRSSRPA